MAPTRSPVLLTLTDPRAPPQYFSAFYIFNIRSSFYHIPRKELYWQRHTELDHTPIYRDRNGNALLHITSSIEFQFINNQLHFPNIQHWHACMQPAQFTQKNSKKANCNLGISKNNSESHKGLSSTNELFKSEPCTVPTTSYQIIWE